MTVERQALFALKWAALAKLAGQLVSWAVTLVVLRLLAPQDYGLMAVVTVSLTIVATLAELGIDAAVVQAPSVTRDELRKVNGLIAVTHAVLFIALLGAAPLLAWIYQQDQLTLLIQVAAVQIPIAAMGTLPQALAERELDMRRLARIEVTATVFAATITLALALSGVGVWALVLGSLANASTRALLLLQRTRVRPSFDLRGIERLLPIGFSVLFSRLSWTLIYQSDVLIGARRLGPDAIGAYSAALHLATLPMQKISGVINAVALPAVARLQGDRERLSRRLLEASRLLTACSVPVLWGISAVGPELVHLVLGERWAAAALPVQLISLVVPLRMLHGTFATATLGIGRAALSARNTAVSALIMPTAFLVGSNWGVNGLAASWLVAIPVLFAANFWRVAEALGVRLRQVADAVWRPVMAGLAMYGAVALARTALAELTDGGRLPLLVLVGAVAYLGVLHLLDRDIYRDVTALARSAGAQPPAAPGV